MDVNMNCFQPMQYIKQGNFPLHINDKIPLSRLFVFSKLVQTILLRPITKTVALTYRITKLLTWVPVKAGLYKISGYHTKSYEFFEQEYLKTIKVVRDLLFNPSVAKRAFQDMIATRENVNYDIVSKPAQEYLNVGYTKGIQIFSSYLYGRGTFEVIYPKEITEFPATSDASLQTIMASHLFKPGMMAINFGSPNVATFITEEKENGDVETVKVDAKSLRREEMSFHPTHGKIQSGVFFVPTNLPQEALERFQQAAHKMAGRKDITCVNTNCRVLQEAGFSIEGVALDEVVFPNTFAEHLLFRNVYYTDTKNVKHKVHFDIINTTKNNLEQYFDKVDTAVVGTRLRHRRRHADTKEKQEARGAAAQQLIDQEKARVKAAEPVKYAIGENIFGQRKVTVSVPSSLGNVAASFWGRHTIYEVDLSDKKEEIAQAFQNLAKRMGETTKLRPFSQKNPSFVTRLKKNIFFSGPMIRLLRRHMMGRVDTITLQTDDIFKYLQSTAGAHLNYAILDDKIVLSMVHANSDSDEVHRQAADWALSKHALIAGRKEVYCSGEIWYDETTKRFVMNDDSGTYTPNLERVQLTVELANRIFTTGSEDLFEAKPVKA